MPYPRKNLTGQRFGHLTVLEFKDRNDRGNSRWVCQCDCGKKRVVYYQHLVQKNTKSCGCGLIKRGVKKGTVRGKLKKKVVATTAS